MEINNLKSSVSNGKSLIASAITDKGVSTASNATFQTMANNIGNISTSTKFLPYKIPLYVTHSNPIVNEPFSVTNRYSFSLDWGNAFTKQAFDALQIVDPNNVYVSTYQSDSYYPYSSEQYGGHICATGRIQGTLGYIIISYDNNCYGQKIYPDSSMIIKNNFAYSYSPWSLSIQVNSVEKDSNGVSVYGTYSILTETGSHDICIFCFIKVSF